MASPTPPSSPYALWARKTVRAYPFKKGRSELKKILGRFIKPSESIVIEVVPGLQLLLKNYSGYKRVFWWYEEIEGNLQYFIRRYLKVGARMIDIGANTGIEGLLAARLKSAQVKMVEANLTIAATLQQTLALNPKLSIEMYAMPCALKSDDRFPGQETISIAEIMDKAGWDKIDFLKIDVDGPDFEVLRSAGSYLTSDKIESIYIETESAREEDIQSVVALGYVPFAVKRTRLPHMQKLFLNHTDEVYFMPYVAGGKSMPENILFVAGRSPLSAHLAKWSVVAG